MTTVQRLTVAGALALALASCAKGKDEQLAYDLCLAAAKKEQRAAAAAR